MAGFEQTIIIGNVGRDAEQKFLPDGTAVTNFSVAVGTQWTDRQTGEKREKTNWYSVSAFGGVAEVLGKYVKKGDQIMIEGAVTARAYLGQDGEPRASLDLRVHNFQFLGGRNDGDYDEREGTGGETLDDIPFSYGWDGV